MPSSKFFISNSGVISRVQAIPRYRIKNVPVYQKFKSPAKYFKANVTEMPIISVKKFVRVDTLPVKKPSKTLVKCTTKLGADFKQKDVKLMHTINCVVIDNSNR